MNNYCRNCGEKLENNVNICPKCNVEVFENRINIDSKKKEMEEYKEKENRYIIIIVSLYALSYFLRYLGALEQYSLISMFNPLIYLGATIMLIYARITLNDSKKIRIMFNIFMILLLIYIFFMLYMLITCGNFINRNCA